MSRSYKKHPYQAVTGNCSAHQDKTDAARGVRRFTRMALHTCTDFEDFTAPHRYECPWNNTYSWNRDGRQRYQGLTAEERNCPPEWYLQIMRK